MIPINNSDTAWLIVADYNQDNDLPHEELREDVINPEINSWCYDFEYDHIQPTIFNSGPHSAVGCMVGGCTSNSCSVGGETQWIGGFIPAIRPIFNFDDSYALLVGGNPNANLLDNLPDSYEES